MPVQNTTVSQDPQGNQIVTLTIDFSDSPNQNIVLGGSLQTTGLEILSMFCDLSGSDSPLRATSQAAGATPGFSIKGRTIGYYPVFYRSPVTISLVFNGAAQQPIVVIQLSTKRIPGPIWAAVGV